MINLFRKNKWRIHFIDNIGEPEKYIILTAKSMSLAKERFQYLFGDKTIVRVMLVP